MGSLTYAYWYIGAYLLTSMWELEVSACNIALLTMLVTPINPDFNEDPYKPIFKLLFVVRSVDGEGA